jgi:hypothetical protein
VQPRIHHIGQVVADIETHLTRSIWEPLGEVVVDPIQKSRLVLAGYPGCAGEPFIELVQPLGEDSPVWKALEKGGGWHHVCLCVESRAFGDRLARERRMLGVTEWAPAVLFGGRSVRFVYSRNRELIELLANELER